MAAAQDEQTSKRFSEQQGELAILACTKSELLAQLPQSMVGEDIAQKPESLAIKQALDHI